MRRGAGDGNVRFLRLPEVLTRVGMRRSAWYARIADGRAPQPLKVGTKLAVWTDDIISRYQGSILEHGERVGQYQAPETR